MRRTGTSLRRSQLSTQTGGVGGESTLLIGALLVRNRTPYRAGLLLPISVGQGARVRGRERYMQPDIRKYSHLEECTPPRENSDEHRTMVLARTVGESGDGSTLAPERRIYDRRGSRVQIAHTEGCIGGVLRNLHIQYSGTHGAHKPHSVVSGHVTACPWRSGDGRDVQLRYRGRTSNRSYRMVSEVYRKTACFPSMEDAHSRMGQSLYCPLPADTRFECSR